MEREREFINEIQKLVLESVIRNNQFNNEAYVLQDMSTRELFCTTISSKKW